MLTCQIRVHAQHLKHAVLGDEAYGGAGGAAVAVLTRNLHVGGHGKVKHLVAGLERPCLHAQTLGWVGCFLSLGWEERDIPSQPCFWDDVEMECGRWSMRSKLCETLILGLTWLAKSRKSPPSCVLIGSRVCSFVHPHSGKEMYFAAETPDDFLQVLSELRKLGEVNAL